ncbi:MAG: hypothetical protein V4726_12090 [Verrucomicrobiota bacterium]
MNTHPIVPARLWRQGDILIEECQGLPEGCQPRPNRIIARGEATGHAHRVKAFRAAAQLFHPPQRAVRDRNRGLLYLKVSEAGCVISHPEHGPIPLAAGCYLLWRQREFDPLNGVTRTAGD